MARNPTVYSKVLLAASITPGTPVDVTVPDGVVWVLRDIQGLCIANANVYTAATLAVNEDVLIQWALAPNTGIPTTWDGRLVCQPGDIILCQVSATLTSWVFQISGYELTLP